MPCDRPVALACDLAAGDFRIRCKLRSAYSSTMSSTFRAAESVTEPQVAPATSSGYMLI